MLLAFIRKIIPQPLLSAYHLFMALSGALYYRNPSKKMITIGITGTSGKSSTVFLLGKILNAAGHKVGSSSTIEFCVGDDCTLNKTKMTQLGRWGTQRMLSRMQRAGCDVAIVETTSQGIEQFRHRGVAYDVCVLTNLYPEHIEAHGNFENYKNAKKKLFAYLATRAPKRQFDVPKTAIINGRIESAKEFLAYPVARRWTTLASAPSADRSFIPENILVRGYGGSFTVDLVKFNIPLLGEHVVDNAVTAVACANAIGIGLQLCADVLATISSVPGRTEFVKLNAQQPFKVIVDFAFEPVAMQKLYEVVEKIPHERIVHVLGGTGGGRDKARRPILGKIAGERATLVVVTNEDPYDRSE